MEERKKGLFTSLADFAARVNPRAINKRVIESLAAAGAFDTLEPNRARVFAGADAILAACQRSHEAATIGQNDMFGGAADAPTIMLPQVEPWLPADRLRREYDAIGFFLSGHPLDDYATVLKRLRVQSWAEFSRAVKTGATAGKVAATVVSRMERRTKTGNKMGIMGLSDPTGHFEAVLFSEGLAQYREVLEPGAAVLLQLGAELQGEDVRARVLHAEPLDDAAAKTQKGLRIFVRDTKPLDSIARRLNMPEAAPANGAGRAPAGETRSDGFQRRRGRRLAGDHARPRNRGGDEAAGPLQGLAADRRRAEGGVGRGGRSDAVRCRNRRLGLLSPYWQRYSFKCCSGSGAPDARREPEPWWMNDARGYEPLRFPAVPDPRFGYCRCLPPPSNRKSASRLSSATAPTPSRHWRPQPMTPA